MYYITGEQKILAVIAHISYFLGGLGFLLVPLLIFLLKKDDDFVSQHAKQALTAHIVLLVLSAIVGILIFLLIGVLLIPVLAVVGFVFLVTSLIAAYRAMNGEEYEYPMIQGIVRKF